MKWQATNGVLLVLLAVLALSLWGCGAKSVPSAEDPGLITVVTTIQPMADITSNIGGDWVRVVNLLPAGGSPHTYEPTPRQMAAMADASVFIWVGAGLDDWAETLAGAGSSRLVKVRVTDSVELLPFQGEHNHDLMYGDDQLGHIHDEVGHGQDHQDAHAHGLYDPHVWLDPLLVRDHIAPAIAQALTDVLPDREAEFAGNLAAYREQLDDLHLSIAQDLNGLSNKSFIAFHSAWPYFCARYGLVQAASVEESPGKEPSAKWIAEVVETAKRNNAKAIFAEPQFSNKAAEVIAREYGTDVLILDPLGGPNVEGRDSYLNLMRYNTRIFQQGLCD
ncbi:MAG: zinc ABC transporter substrate-binding protein [Desulforudis sp.]|jgi:zinc transport system substrate-binding protein|nr:MAG: zinc ABC transporter substrate-binding protein [Desulforudis sp.]